LVLSQPGGPISTGKRKEVKVLSLLNQEEANHEIMERRLKK
jgi:hypothetical protein